MRTTDRELADWLLEEAIRCAWTSPETAHQIVTLILSHGVRSEHAPPFNLKYEINKLTLFLCHHRKLTGEQAVQIVQKWLEGMKHLNPHLFAEHRIIYA